MTTMTPAPPAPADGSELTLAELATLRAALQQCQQDRTRLLRAVEDEVVPSKDPGGRAYAEAIRETLRDVEAALGRMAAGTYGRCGSCRLPIPVERMQLVPFADECLACHERSGAGG